MLGLAFMGIKAYEYYDKYQTRPRADSRPGVQGRDARRTFPRGAPRLASLLSESRFDPGKAQLFYGLYFAMTGVHFLHMVIGIAILLLFLRPAARGRFTSGDFVPVELMGLYWHFVDIIWIFLFPLLYLIDRSGQ